MRKLLRAALTITVVTVAIAVSIPAAGASSWPMFQGNAQRDGCASSSRIKPALAQSWIRPPVKSYLEKRTRPVAADGLVYVGRRWSTYLFAEKIADHGQVQALSLQDGEPAWTAPDIFASAAPALANGMVYVGADDGRVYALGARDGVVRWSADVGGRPNAPAPYGHKLIVTTAAGRVCALDAATGEAIWSTERSRLLYAPAVYDGVAVVGGAECAAFDVTDGGLRWSYNNGSLHYSTPTLGGDAVYVSCPYATYRLNRASGAEVWSHLTLDKYGALRVASFDGATLYWGAVTAIDAETGQVKWSFDSQNTIVGASVALANGLVFVGASKRHTNISSDHSDGRLYVLSASTGELLWEYKAGLRYGDSANIDPSPAIAENRVVTNLSTTQLACFAEGESEPLPLAVEASRDTLNPYDLEWGQVDVSFELKAPASVTVSVLDHRGKSARVLVGGVRLDTGRHTYTWHGLIDLPEIVDADLAARFGDRGVLVAPDGDYALQVFVESDDGLEYRGRAPVAVEAGV